MSKRARVGRSGNKFRISAGLPTLCVTNYADNTGAKNLYIIVVGAVRAKHRKVAKGFVDEFSSVSVNKGNPELRKKVHPSVIISQRKPYRRREGYFLYFEENAGVIVILRVK